MFSLLSSLVTFLVLAATLWFMADWVLPRRILSALRCASAMASIRPKNVKAISATTTRSTGPLRAELPGEIWLFVLSFSGVRDLCRCASVNRVFNEHSSDDELWRWHCKRRWQDKLYMPLLLFSCADFRRVSATLTVTEMKHILQQRKVDMTGAVEAEELRRLVHRTTRPNPKLPPQNGKWKTSFAFAEQDSNRQKVTPEEIAFFRWELIYNGQRSTAGLRHFRSDGVFESRFLGRTNWSLTPQGDFVIGNHATLKVCRNAHNWGWIIGLNTSTEYHSRLPSYVH
eukprot:gb/GEZN01012929.1/.p1 GENE.gb/GEZN01012929.1/~~gb/GEZN01012929.1/.p1  ORF type:complete len:285 (-),score=12.90 gb/GEZN01012929.1/:152-1006(-)